jgi:hypothetical protein
VACLSGFQSAHEKLQGVSFIAAVRTAAVTGYPCGSMLSMRESRRDRRPAAEIKRTPCVIFVEEEHREGLNLFIAVSLTGVILALIIFFL